jgi:hypothetical protein
LGQEAPQSQPISADLDLAELFETVARVARVDPCIGLIIGPSLVGYGEKLMDWLAEEARRLGCEGLHLDSGVAADRASAHRLYMRNGLRISAHHFEREI